MGLLASALLSACQSAHPYPPVRDVIATRPSASSTPIDDVGIAPACPLPAFETCAPCTCREYPLGEIYLGAAVTALPGLGPTIEGGQVFRRSAWAVWSFELAVTYQDLESDPFGVAGAGAWGEVQGGVKATLLPCRRIHPTLRAGLAWFRTTEPNDLVEDPGDYPALYGGLGIEYDFGRFTTGPEVRVLVASKESSFDPIVVPQIAWHFLVRF